MLYVCIYINDHLVFMTTLQGDISILRVRKQRIRSAKWLARSHTASKWQIWDLNPTWMFLPLPPGRGGASCSSALGSAQQSLWALQTPSLKLRHLPVSFHKPFCATTSTSAPTCEKCEPLLLGIMRQQGPERCGGTTGRRKAAQNQLATKAGLEIRQPRCVALERTSCICQEKRGVTWVMWANGAAPWPRGRKWGQSPAP